MRPVPAPERLCEVACRFDFYGDLCTVTPYGSGHINDTYRVDVNQAGTAVSYILQRLNTDIFRDPAAVMRNIQLVTEHLAKRLGERGVPDVSRRTLTLVPTRDGRIWLNEPDGVWRMYLFITGARTYDQIEHPRQAEAAAAAFAEFQRDLADFPPRSLAETIPDFHHTRRRFETLKTAIREDCVGRAARVGPEIEFALAREPIVDTLLNARAAGRLPDRVIHNDTKLNNVLLDDVTGAGVCVIDLDTVMPGLVHYDFGDMCRTATRPTPEDETRLERVAMRREMFEALARGYLSRAAPFLLPAEVEWLAFSARLITFEIGIRFLTDYLLGDVYFKIRRPDHNLDRCRVQFRMVESFEANESWMQDVIAQLWRTYRGESS